MAAISIIDHLTSNLCCSQSVQDTRDTYPYAFNIIYQKLCINVHCVLQCKKQTGHIKHIPLTLPCLIFLKNWELFAFKRKMSPLSENAHFSTNSFFRRKCYLFKDFPIFQFELVRASNINVYVVPARGFLFSLSRSNQLVPGVSSRPDQTRSDQKITQIAENVKM